MECNHGSTHTLSTERTPVPAPQNTAAREVYDKERAHVLAPWSAWGARDPMVITAAEGCYLTDGDGNRLLDFTSQLVNTNIGHQHPVVVKAIQDQAAELCTINPAYANAARAEAARLVAEVAPDRKSTRLNSSH